MVVPQFKIVKHSEAYESAVTPDLPSRPKAVVGLKYLSESCVEIQLHSNRSRSSLALKHEENGVTLSFICISNQMVTNIIFLPQSIPFT